jgi:hypothetical protein
MDDQSNASRNLPVFFVFLFVLLVWLRDWIDRLEMPPPLRYFFRSIVACGVLLLFVMGWKMLRG